MRKANSVSFDPVADYYDATRGFPPGVEQDAAELIVKAGDLTSESRILEIGVGTGRIALPVADNVGQYVGIDIAAKMMAVLQANQGSKRVDLAQASGTMLPFPDASYDAVITVHVFHLIPAWQQVLREIRRVLKPAGVLLNGGGLPGQVRELRRHAFGSQFPMAGAPHQDLLSFLAESGWHHTHHYTTFYTSEIVPISLLHQLQQRLWSPTWTMSKADIQAASERLKRHLHEQFEDPTEPFPLDSAFNVGVFRPSQ